MTVIDDLNIWSQAALNMDADAALDAVVEQFYTKIIVNPDLVRYFEGVDMEKLHRHQVKFLKYALSDSVFEYSKNMMQRAHARLFAMGLCAFEFDIVTNTLVETLNGFNVPKQIIDAIVSKIAPLRSVFVECSQNQSGNDSAVGKPYAEH